MPINVCRIKHNIKCANIPGSTDIEKLEPWPFDGAASNYEIISGNPQASGRIDRGTASSQHRIGIWSCSKGVFSCTELGDELQTIISGRLILTRENRESIECRAGDSIFTGKGERLTWDIREAVTKVFFSYNSEGSNPGWD